MTYGRCQEGNVIAEWLNNQNSGEVCQETIQRNILAITYKPNGEAGSEKKCVGLPPNLAGKGFISFLS